jgi:hypothetical protein
VPQLVLLPFGAVKGDKVSYRVDCPHGFGGAVLGIRYRTCKAGGGDCVFRSEGLFDGEMRFAPSDGLGVAFFPVGKITPGPAGLTLTAEGGGDGIELDCLFITEGSQSSGVSFTTVPYGRVPEISDSGSAKLYRYPGVGTVYGLAPLADRVRCRAIPTGSLEDAMISRLSNPDPTFDDVCEPFTRSFSRKHTNEGFYHNTIIPSIYIKPGETHIEYAVVFAGSPPSLGKDECEALYAARRAPESLGFTAKGKKYEFGTRLLKSTLLGNIVYPDLQAREKYKAFYAGQALGLPLHLGLRFYRSRPARSGAEARRICARHLSEHSRQPRLRVPFPRFSGPDAYLSLSRASQPGKRQVRPAWLLSQGAALLRVSRRPDARFDDRAL